MKFLSLLLPWAFVALGFVANIKGFQYVLVSYIWINVFMAIFGVVGAVSPSVKLRPKGSLDFLRVQGASFLILGFCCVFVEFYVSGAAAIIIWFLLVVLAEELEQKSAKQASEDQKVDSL